MSVLDVVVLIVTRAIQFLPENPEDVISKQRRSGSLSVRLEQIGNVFVFAFAEPVVLPFYERAMGPKTVSCNIFAAKFLFYDVIDLQLGRKEDALGNFEHPPDVKISKSSNEP